MRANPVAPQNILFAEKYCISSKVVTAGNLYQHDTHICLFSHNYAWILNDRPYKTYKNPNNPIKENQPNMEIELETRQTDQSENAKVFFF